MTQDPLCHSIRPTLTHATSLGSLQAAPCSTPGHAIGDTMGILIKEGSYTNISRVPRSVPHEQRYRSQEHRRDPWILYDQ